MGSGSTYGYSFGSRSCAQTEESREFTRKINVENLRRKAPKRKEKQFARERRQTRGYEELLPERKELPLGHEELAHARAVPDGPAVPRLRKRMDNGLNFPPNFEGLVLGCIDADFCK